MTLRILCESDTTAQCESFVIFLLPRFYVKSFLHPNYRVSNLNRPYGIYIRQCGNLGKFLPLGCFVKPILASS